jgi:hypothetical protein
VKQCAVLIVDPHGVGGDQAAFLTQQGFNVSYTAIWPDDDATLVAYEIVIVCPPDVAGAAMLAARLRAKPHFGRRVLFGILPDTIHARDAQELRASGFDDVVVASCDGRLLMAKILRRLRERPEYRCLLPGVGGENAA